MKVFYNFSHCLQLFPFIIQNRMMIVCVLVLLKILPAVAMEPVENLPELCSARNDFCPSGYYCSTTSHRCWPCHICGEVDIAFHNTPTKCLCDGGRDDNPFLICGAFIYPGETTRGPLIHTLDDLAPDLIPDYAHYFDGQYAARNPSSCPQKTTPTASLTTEVQTSTRLPSGTYNNRNVETSSQANINCSDPGQPEHGYQIKSNYNRTINFGCDESYTIEGETTVYCLENGTWSAEKPICKLDNRQSLQSAGPTLGTELIVFFIFSTVVFCALVLLLLYCRCRYFKPDRSIRERPEEQQGGEDGVVSDQTGTSQYDPMIMQNSNGNVASVAVRMEELPMTPQTVIEFSDETLTEITWTLLQPLLEAAFEDENFKREFLKQWLPTASSGLLYRLNHVTGANLYQALKEESEVFGVNTYEAIGNALQDQELRRNFPSQQKNTTLLINALVEADTCTQKCSTCSERQQQELETIA